MFSSQNDGGGNREHIRLSGNKPLLTEYKVFPWVTDEQVVTATIE